MRRSVHFAATIALALATAVGMFAAAIVLKPPPLSASTTDGVEVVHRFYDAINAVLRTGDPTALETIVAPHFTMHGVFVAVSPDRDGLARQLVATSAVAPDLQLEIEEMSVAGDRALAHLARTSGTGAAFLGIPLATTPVFWGRFDALRMDGGQVVELWSGEESLPLLEPLRQTRLDPLLTPNHAMMFRRLGAEAGYPWTWDSTYQSRVLYVEVGTITVEVDPASPAPAVIFAPGHGHGQGRPVPPRTQTRVWPGEALALSPTVRYRLHGDGSLPDLRVYEAAFPRYTGMSLSGAGLATPPTEGTASRPRLPLQTLLAEATSTGLPHTGLVVSFGRITLPPGSPLALSAAPGPVLLTVEAGTLEIDTRQVDPPTATTFAPGDATLIPIDEIITLQAVGADPVVVFAVSIVPPHARTRIESSNHGNIGTLGTLGTLGNRFGDTKQHALDERRLRDRQ